MSLETGFRQFPHRERLIVSIEIIKVEAVRKLFMSFLCRQKQAVKCADESIILEKGGTDSIGKIHGEDKMFTMR
jgi:hypothetical protein